MSLHNCAMTILLTGATGFIGKEVLSQLLSEGHVVFAFCRSPEQLSRLCNLGHLIPIRGDLANGNGFDDVEWAKLDAVVHLAASGVKASDRAWSGALAGNVIGTQRLLSFIKLRARKTPKVFLARTFYERFVQSKPILFENPYIATKFTASAVAAEWATTYDGSVSFGTFFQIYGPEDDPGSVLSYAVSELKHRRKAVFGSGLGLRDWLYVTDAARAVIMDIKSNALETKNVDIGSGSLVSLKDVILILAKMLGAPEENVIFDATLDRPDTDLTLGATDLIQNWKPMITLNEGLGRLVKSA